MFWIDKGNSIEKRQVFSRTATLMLLTIMDELWGDWIHAPQNVRSVRWLWYEYELSTENEWNWIFFAIYSKQKFIVDCFVFINKVQNIIYLLNFPYRKNINNFIFEIDKTYNAFNSFPNNNKTFRNKIA